MRTILDWLRHLLWRARSDDAPADCVTAWMTVGDLDLTPHLEDCAAEPDLVLRAPDGEAAAAMLAHLGELQTIDRLLVLGAAELPPAERRRVARAGRAQRQHGLWVELG